MSKSNPSVGSISFRSILSFLEPITNCLRVLWMQTMSEKALSCSFIQLAVPRRFSLFILVTFNDWIQDDDIPGIVRYHTYEVLKKEVDDPRLRWAYLPYSMHMAGPREAIQHMIIRKNYGTFFATRMKTVL